MGVGCLSRLVSLALAAVVSMPLEAAAQIASPDAAGAAVIDVSVVDRDGSPVTSLSPRDFSVSIDGSQRRVAAVTVRNFGRRALDGDAASASLDRVADRTFLLVLDRSRLERAQRQAAAKAARQFVDALLPGERVEFQVVPALQPAGPTLDADRENVKRRIEESASTAAAASAAEAARLGATALDEMVALVGLLAAQEGPKHVVIVAGAERRRVSRVEVPDMPPPTESSGRDSSRPQVTRPRDDEPLPVGDARVAALADAAMEAGAVVHVLQLGAGENGGAEVGAFSRASGGTEAMASGLIGVATRTGGFGSSSLEPGAYFKRLARELSASYALSVATAAGDREARVRRLRVRVEGPKGIVVRARERVRLDAPSTGVAAQAGDVSGPEKGAAAPALRADPALLDRATAYVQRFGREFTHVVAEERYVQVASEWTGQRPLPARDPRLRWIASGSLGDRDYRRQLLSDFLLVQSSSATWHAYRDVAEVDLRKVRDRAERVSRLFIEATPDSRAQLDAIVDESARLNIGFSRTINTPTFALQILLPHLRGRFAFDPAPADPVDLACCAVVRFHEVQRPTIVRSRDGADVPLSGSVWIEPATGVVRRTVLETKPAGTVPESTIDVSYRPTGKVSVRVPTQMYEYYRAPRSASLSYVEGLATYSNFRVFSVTTSETLP